VAELFRQSEVLRQNRERARPEIPVFAARLDADSFLACVTERSGSRSIRLSQKSFPQTFIAITSAFTRKSSRDFRMSARMCCAGRVTPEQLRTAADLSIVTRRHLRNTIMQNLLIVNVPNQHGV